MSKESLGGILPVDHNTVQKAAITIASAFANDPSTLYAFPNPTRRANLHHIFAYQLKLDISGGGKVYTISPRCEGVACWHTPGVKTSWLSKLRAGFFQLPRYGGLHYMRHALQEDRFYERLRQKHAPEKYVYLTLLAVAPEHQGNGYASRLIQHMLAFADKKRLPCYVETQNMKNVNMYSNYGFEVREFTHFPTGSECEVYIMVRKPVS